MVAPPNLLLVAVKWALVTKFLWVRLVSSAKLNMLLQVRFLLQVPMPLTVANFIR